MNIVMYQPEIPANTGNISRTCFLTNTKLHLIKPLGFKLYDKQLKRAGLDYWGALGVKVYQDFEDFLTKNQRANLFFASTKADKFYHQVRYPENSYIVMGPESRGLPSELLASGMGQLVKVPMVKDSDRSLNLANAAAIILYEALRQQDFKSL